MEKQTGFTLIELMLTVAIFAVLTAIAIPNMIGWRNNAKFNGAVNTLAGDLQVAKQSAIRHNAMVAVIFSTKGYTIFIDDGNGSGMANDGSCNGSEQIIRDRTMPSGVTIGSITFTNKTTCFDGKGLCSQTGDITLSDTTNHRSLSVNRLGRISTS